MLRFRALKRQKVQPGTRVYTIDDGLPLSLKPEESALKSMTDLRRIPAASIKPEKSIEQAKQQMIHNGVRMLFVIKDIDFLVGLVTARDIMGEKPIRIAAEKNIAHSSITVQDVMAPLEQIEALDFSEVQHSMVGDIVLTLHEAGRQHALVSKETPQGMVIVGVFSITQTGKQLGVTIPADDRVQSFAELEHIIAGDD